MMTDPPRVPHSLPEPSRPQMFNPLLLNELCDTVEELTGRSSNRVRELHRCLAMSFYIRAGETESD